MPDFAAVKGFLSGGGVEATTLITRRFLLAQTAG